MGNTKKAESRAEWEARAIALFASVLVLPGDEDLFDNSSLEADDKNFDRDAGEQVDASDEGFDESFTFYAPVYVEFGGAAGEGGDLYQTEISYQPSEDVNGHANPNGSVWMNDEGDRSGGSEWHKLGDELAERLGFDVSEKDKWAEDVLERGLEGEEENHRAGVFVKLLAELKERVGEVARAFAKEIQADHAANRKDQREADELGVSVEFLRLSKKEKEELTACVGARKARRKAQSL